MGAVRDRLTRIQQMLAEVAATVTSTAGEVQRVTDDMSPEDVVSTLDPAAKKIGATSTSASAILSELDGLKGEIAKTLKGGQPRPLMALADQMKNALVQVSGYLGAAKQRTDETIAEARQAGNF
jgi:ABC-type transporter Mla subunit MlaD